MPFLAIKASAAAMAFGDQYGVISLDKPVRCRLALFSHWEQPYGRGFLEGPGVVNGNGLGSGCLRNQNGDRRLAIDAAVVVGLGKLVGAFVDGDAKPGGKMRGVVIVALAEIVRRAGDWLGERSHYPEMRLGIGATRRAVEQHPQGFEYLGGVVERQRTTIDIDHDAGQNLGIGVMAQAVFVCAKITEYHQLEPRQIALGRRVGAAQVVGEGGQVGPLHSELFLRLLGHEYRAADHCSRSHVGTLVQ